MMQGDSAYQATLRAQAIRDWDNLSEGDDPGPLLARYALAELRPGTRLLDVGCGTGHILARLLTSCPAPIVAVGLDASAFMLAEARTVPGLCLVQGDAYQLPIATASIDVLLSRLADYAAKEVARVLRPNGVFLEHGLGPLDSEEIARAFGVRYMSDYAPDDPDGWFARRNQDFASAGLHTETFSIFASTDLLTRQQLEETIAMVPLAEDFAPDRDAAVLDAMPTRLDSQHGLRWTIRRQATLRLARRLP